MNLLLRHSISIFNLVFSFFFFSLLLISNFFHEKCIHICMFINIHICIFKILLYISHTLVDIILYISNYTFIKN